MHPNDAQEEPSGLETRPRNRCNLEHSTDRPTSRRQDTSVLGMPLFSPDGMLLRQLACLGPKPAHIACSRKPAYPWLNHAEWTPMVPHVASPTLRFARARVPRICAEAYGPHGKKSSASPSSSSSSSSSCCLAFVLCGLGRLRECLGQRQAAETCTHRPAFKSSG